MRFYQFFLLPLRISAADLPKIKCAAASVIAKEAEDGMRETATDKISAPASGGAEPNAPGITPGSISERIREREIKTKGSIPGP